MRLVVPRLMKEKNVKKVCTIYQDDEFGLEVMRGAEAALKAMDMEYTEKTTYKRGATDFSSQVARMKAAECELVVMGTVIRETIGTIAEARKTGFNPVLRRLECGLHRADPQARRASHERPLLRDAFQIPYLDEGSQQMRFWATKYKTKFGEDPSVFSVYGYVIIDTFAKAAGKAGAGLTHRQLRQGDGDDDHPGRHVRRGHGKFTPTQHLGSDLSRLSQIQDGKWKVISDYIKP